MKINKVLKIFFIAYVFTIANCFSQVISLPQWSPEKAEDIFPVYDPEGAHD